MIRFDYYTPSNKLPRWVVATLAVGGTAIALCLMVLMVHLGRTQLGGVAGAVAAAPSLATPTPAPTPVVTTPVAAEAAVVAPVEPVAKAEPKAVVAKKGHHRAGKPHLSNQKVGALLAKHDSVKKRRSRDDLDRMLGM